MSVAARWKEVESLLREKAYRVMFADPDSLLMHDGGPLSIDADLYLARLMGLDDEVVDEWWIHSLTDVLRVPILHRVSAQMFEGDPWDLPPMGAARYVLQSGWVVQTMSALVMAMPPNVQLRPDGTVKIAYLLYRRRL